MRMAKIAKFLSILSQIYKISPIHRVNTPPPHYTLYIYRTELIAGEGC